MFGIESERSWVRVTDGSITFFFSLFVSLVTKKLWKSNIYYQLIIFFGKCKNHEMPYYIKFLNRKGIEVSDGSPHVCFLLYWELDRIFGLRADLSSRQYFFLGKMKI